jgi:Zn-dependent metalloprotease
MRPLRLALLALPLGLCAQPVNESDPAVQAARGHFTANAAVYGLSNPAEELRFRLGREGSGLKHIRFRQYYRGLPVFGAEAIAHVGAQGVWVTNGLRPRLNVDTAAAVSRDTAREIARQRAGITGDFQTEIGDLHILPRGFGSASQDTLVWFIRVLAENPVDIAKQWDVFVNAKTAAVVWAFDSLHTANGPKAVNGNTMWSGQIRMPGFEQNGQDFLFSAGQSGLSTTDMNNGTSGNGTIFKRPAGTTFGDGNKNHTDRATAGADAHFGQAATWQYFARKFSRDGIDGAGRRAIGRVHYSSNYENAYWSDSCFCMTYGDGFATFYSLTSIDVAGHEMAHGVTSSEADLIYSGESGGLNESTSDIFGTMVEFYVNNAADTPEYWIGERIYRSNWPTPNTYVQNNALRYMDWPNKDGNSPNCWYAGIGNLDVHYSSGPSNHMFHLLAEGGTSKCNSKSVTGIGRDAAAAIWYRALTNYMVPTTNYAAAKTAALNAANELYGAGSPQSTAVVNAFAAINVN